MDTHAASIKALGTGKDGQRAGGDEALRDTDEWTDDRAILDAWSEALVSVRGRSQATACPLEAEGVVWHEVGQIFSILVRRGKGSGQGVRLPLDRPVSRMLGMWLVSFS